MNSLCMNFEKGKGGDKREGDHTSTPAKLPCLRGRGVHQPSRAMAQGLVSLLSLFLLSATVPTGLYAFTCPHPSIATFQRPNAQYFLHAHTSGAAARHRRSCTRQTTDLLAGTPEVVSSLASQEDRLREEGVDGVGRAQLAESISEEFRVRVNEVRQTYDVRLEQERALHRLEMARQRVKLLQVRSWLIWCAPGKSWGCLRSG